MAVRFNIKSTSAKAAYVRLTDNNTSAIRFHSFVANNNQPKAEKVQSNSEGSKKGDVRIDVARDQAGMNEGIFNTVHDGDIIEGSEVVIADEDVPLGANLDSGRDSSGEAEPVA
jgi:alanine dehydrogenase